MFVSIETALYKHNGIEEKIEIDEMEEHEDFEMMRKNIYCTFEGCAARLEYVPKGKNKAHFKTWPNENHSKDCFDFFEREKKKKSERGSATINVPLSSKHISRVLRELYKEANESEEEKKKRLVKKRNNKNKKKNIIKDDSGDTISIGRVNPTTAEVTETHGEIKRAPSVRKRSNIQLLSEGDVGYTRAVNGYVRNISIKRDRVVMEISSKKKKCKVYFEEEFFAHAVVNILGMLQNAKEYLSQGRELQITCVGEVEKRGEEFRLVVNKQHNFRLNGEPIAVFSFKYLNNEF